jgi:hypothetical protein
MEAKALTTMQALIKPLNGEMVMVLRDDILKALGIAVGETVEVFFDARGVSLASNDASRSVRLQRGRDFMNRYRETLDILAK